MQHQFSRFYSNTNRYHDNTRTNPKVMIFIVTFYLQFKLLSLNVRGIQTFEKRKRRSDWLAGKQNTDIYFV